MEIPLPLANLIAQARTMGSTGPAGLVGLKATIVTPVAHIVPVGLETMVTHSDFQLECADVATVVLRLQPGVYQDQVLPYKDNLIIELVETSGLNATSKRYRATPQSDGDNRIQGSHSSVANMGNVDVQNFLSLSFFLMEIGFDAMRNTTVSGAFLSAKPDDVLHNLLTTTCQGLGLKGVDAFKGVDIEKPIDNPKVFRQILVKQGTRLVNLANYLQKEEGVGIYTRGIGSFYRNGFWHIYPIAKQGRYGTGLANVDIIRVPQDVAPTLDTTYYKSSKAITIISTGGGGFKDGTDITRQNEGVGEQLVNTSAVSGKTGVHISNGQAVKTRQDSMTEFKSHQRGSGNERVNLSDKPTSNMFPAMSASFIRNMQILDVEWHNSSHYSINPNAPLKYYYMDENNTLTVREGCVISMRTEMLPGNEGVNLLFKSQSILTIFLFPLDPNTVKPNA